jgi:amidase
MEPRIVATLPSALDIAAAMHAGATTARAEVEASLARIAEHEPALNAFTLVRADEALAEAAALDDGGPGHDGPLAGVPVAVKEEYAVAGTVTTLGGRGNSTPATQDSEAIRRLRAAGAIIVGKTTMPEFGQVPFTEALATGVTRNPFNPDRSVGGSSGGSAAAVASGMVPLALGADGGGSIRIPAACTGLIGLKPTRGRISLAPQSQHWYALVVLGGMSRTVADSAALLDVLAGSTSTDRWSLPESAAAPTSYAAAAATDPAPLRVAWTTKAVVAGVSTDAEVAAATESLARVLAALGHRVGHIAPRWPIPTDAFLPQYYAGMREEAESVEHPDLLEPRTRQTVAMSRWATTKAAERAVRRGERIADAIDERLLTDADVLVLPVMPRISPEVGLLGDSHAVRAQLLTIPYVANTAIFNVSGHPAISVPSGRDEHGIPIGVQLVARRGREDVLLALAGQLERAGHA